MSFALSTFADDTGADVVILPDVAVPLSFPVMRDGRAIGVVRYSDDGDRGGWRFYGMGGEDFSLEDFSSRVACIRAGINSLLARQRRTLAAAVTGWQRRTGASR